ncbi:putative sporulation protein YtxC [Clostridium luticellarii]|uniref:YtxC-like family protein n=1 Tax=Clostridium luticellarii TaxID=1691940 RepID=A0A2T0BQU5_9CLOT|nr:putative sporulation protein YtxC [Clostridium luticellarii]MCI1946292.1 putative sporulation protein YtxC [Clostridium luticellarii]MCI1969515.1 putative sporulation protein YtxC [Clostridium luticellarii]MCI1996692.1 putative sporulation protein YtxC [Clostridium luticellarii]MCI2041219.1 putative sporulation protein YtxC [Clostridium luticellarii]PRR86254.1 YtxC-like family protein [Clostridium luticellarii]
MLLLTMVYNKERENVIQGIQELKEYFRHKDVFIGIYESIESDTHFLKLFCDREMSNRLMNIFNMFIANIIYDIVIDEFYKNDILTFLSDEYFFLRYEELEEIRLESINVLKGKMEIVDDNSIFCINKRNEMLDKISNCINENNEINIDGFVTFRIKELLPDLESIVDKVVEKYMVEKEYNEFIKLLKYFVEIQESKIECLNIIIDSQGNYIIRDRQEDITDNFFRDLKELKCSKNLNSGLDDVLISALITNSPDRIIIHCAENCRNPELIETIEKVFTDRVEFCNSCATCKSIKNNFNRV